MPYFPTLRQMGKDQPCQVTDHEAEKLRLPLAGWSRLLAGPHYRCRLCGAYWLFGSQVWSGGSVDWPQTLIEIPTPAEMAEHTYPEEVIKITPAVDVVGAPGR